jgi:hypothetical protein
MAHGREPDLSSFDPSEVRTALERVLRFPVPRQNFLVWLNGRIQVLSEGTVSIEEQQPSPGQVTVTESSHGTVPELRLRLLVEGEPFAEPAIVRADGNAVQFPMRG